MQFNRIKIITEFNCYRDVVPTVLLQGWPLNTDLFDGETISGMVPTLFAENVEVAEEAINADPIKAHYDCQKLNRIFTVPESFSLKEATAFIKKPRQVFLYRYGQKNV